MDRIATLTEILAGNPDDAFARYALAIEYSKAGDVETALQHFKELVARHPDYTNGYFMAAQTLATAGRNADAAAILKDGIACARRTGNQHAASEMEILLDEMER